MQFTPSNSFRSFSRHGTRLAPETVLYPGYPMFISSQTAVKQQSNSSQTAVKQQSNSSQTAVKQQSNSSQTAVKQQSNKIMLQGALP